MAIDELLVEIESKSPPESENDIAAFESENGHPLSGDYRRFLAGCNGGFLGGRFWYHQGDAGVHHIGGFRDESYFSLRWARDCYEDRIANGSHLSTRERGETCQNGGTGTCCFKNSAK